jgi:predicted peptidase
LTPAQRAQRDRHPATAPAEMLASAQQHPQVLQPGHHWLEFATQLGGKPFNLRYALYLPRGYDAGHDRCPLMVYLHNDETRMTDQAMIFQWGSGVDPRREDRLGAPFPMIGLAPQLPENRPWSDPEILRLTGALIDEIARRLRVDTDRVYLTGAQGGGSGAWALANQNPDRFAAVFPFQGGPVTPEETARRLTNVAIRVIAPQADGGAVNAARQMTDAFRKSRAEVRLDIVPNPQGANPWTPYYTDPELVEWLLRHRRAPVGPNAMRGDAPNPS